MPVMRPQLKTLPTDLLCVFKLKKNCGMDKKLKQCLENVDKGCVPLHFQYNPSAEERQFDAEEDRGVTPGTKLDKAVV